MKRILLPLCFMLLVLTAQGQTGTDFWFAPPDITDLHNPPGGVPIYLFVSSTGQAATVTISQPANAAFNGGTPITVSLAANASRRVNLSAFKTQLETRPTNTVTNTGLHIVSTTPVTAYYEISNTNNTDIFALKGANALGTEFYIPLHKYAPFFNHTFSAPDQAFASFDIVASQNATTITIYSPTQVDGHAALTQFSITLNAGQTYSCAWTGANYTQPSTHPGGASVLSDKPIAITLKDDSDQNPSGGCYDLLGDQIVPVNVLGTEYIAVKGQLNNNGDESVFITATQNNTKVYVNGSSTASATLFAGENWRYDMDYLSTGPDHSVYFQTSKPSYAIHITGFGCEMGMALLPQLGCAGSRQVSFVRSTSEGFFLTLLVRATAVNNFTITGPGTATISAASFSSVPGTGGVWKAADIQFNTTQIPVDSTFRISNSADVFAMGIINGGSATGCRYGFFSEFASTVYTDAGPDQTLCANTTAQLAGSITGGATAGIWSTNGSGTFTPNSTTLNAVYVPSAADTTVGTVRLILTSTGSCTAQRDTMYLHFTPAPLVNAGSDLNACGRDSVQLSGSVSGGAITGLWSSSGTGTFYPNAATLAARYIPSVADETGGTIQLNLISTSNGTCIAVSDSLVMHLTRTISVNAGSDTSLCANNATLQLHGTVSGGTSTGQWSSSGNGIFSPASTNLNARYIPSSNDTAAGFVNLILSSTNNGYCSASRDTLRLSFDNAPVVDAGSDITICANNATVTLNGSSMNTPAVVWSSSGSGTFSPSTTLLNATYTPSASDLSLGSVVLRLQSNGPAECTPVRDSLTLTFSPAPQVHAGSDTTLCVNVHDLQLSGSVSGGTNTGTWFSTGSGSFSPDANSLHAIYHASSSDSLNGSVRLVLQSTNNGTCTAVSDTVLVSYTPAGLVNAGSDQTYCANSNAQLSGSFSGTATAAQWTSTGTGSFTPDAWTLNAHYVQSAADTTAGFVDLILTGNTCELPKDTMRLVFSPAPVVSAGANVTTCGRDTLTLQGSVSGGSTTGVWSSNGTGVFSPNATTLAAHYIPSVADESAGSIVLTLTSSGNGTCAAVSDNLSISITPSIHVQAGSDQSLCANNANLQLNGSVSGGSTTGQWTSSGSGYFSPTINTLNGIYIPTTNDTAAGHVMIYLTSTNTGNCTAETDSFRLTFTDAPVVSAGSSQNSCGRDTVYLTGTVSGGATTGLWTSSGDGHFYPSASALNAKYLPGAGDESYGDVQLVLSSTGNGLCLAVRDTIHIYITPLIHIRAGTDTTLCADNGNLLLNGSVYGGSTSGQWSTSGSGLFSPSANTLNATYIPSNSDTAAGQITLVLTTTNTGFCPVLTDSIHLNYTPVPVVSAGTNLYSCSRDTVNLDGSVSGGASTATWTSSGTGRFIPNANTLHVKYVPSALDEISGDVRLVITSTGNGVCNAARDTMHLYITSAVHVNAGSDQTVCANNAQLALSGQVSGGSASGTWTSSGTGYFLPDNTTLNATYVPSVGDTAAGSVYLALYSTNNGACAVQKDSLRANFIPAPVVMAGSDQSICENNAVVQLNGSVQHTSSVLWTSSGSGTFSPSATSLSAQYTASPADISSGAVMLHLSSTSPASCTAVSDSLSITFSGAPSVNAGSDVTLCPNNLSYQLNGLVAGPTTTGTWVSSGTGTFFPDENTTNAVYTASASDSMNGGVQLILTSTGNGSCLAVKDTVLLHFTPAGIVNAGSDFNWCANGTVQLHGSVSGQANAAVWQSLGSGSFLPDEHDLNAVYVQSAADTSLGTVYLVLTGNSCESPKDTIRVTFTPSPQVNAGSDLSVCANAAEVNLQGTLAHANGVLWSGGSGSFASATSVQTTYTPSASEISAGSLTLTLTSSGNGTCVPVSDELTVHITPAPVVNAGSDRSVCKLSNSLQLQGSVSGGSTSGEWSSNGTGSFSPAGSILNCFYLLSPTDTSNGSVQLVLTSTQNGTCAAVSDTMILTLTDGAEVSAGADHYVCASHLETMLSGNVHGGTMSGRWHSSGSGYFIPNDSTLNASYHLSAADSLAGEVTLVLESTNNGLCGAVYDTSQVFVQYTHVVNTGADIRKCPNTDPVLLVGSVQNATGGHWTSSGTGVFSPSDTSLVSYYIPTVADTALGTIYFILQSNNDGGCATASDTTLLRMEPLLQAGFHVVTGCKDVLSPFSDASTLPFGNLNYWFWNFGDGNTSLQQNPEHAYSQTGTYQVTLVVKSDNGCEDQVAQTVNVYPSPQAGFTTNSISFLPGDAVNFINTASGYTQTNWNFGDSALTSSSENPIHTYSAPGTYPVIQVVMNQFGCSDSVKNDVIIRNSEQLIYAPAVPTAFSPNGDGINDTLFVRGGPFKEITFTVWDEWGHAVFSTTKAELGWDGSFHDQFMPVGEYLYTIDALTTENKTYSLRGQVKLIR